jgi:hypothetical protein
MICRGCDGEDQFDGEDLKFDHDVNMWLCEECRDTVIDHKKMTQRYLIHYDSSFGARFGMAVFGNERQARQDRNAFAEDGLQVRIIKLTVVDGQPVAEWIDS